jgi:hypothetical protein
MKLEQRIVTKIPLEELWTESAILSYHRQQYLTESQVLHLLLDGNIAISEASCGLKLSWIASENALEFFKKQIKGHIANDPNRIILEEYEDDWCYLASEWVDAQGKKVILLETYH